MTIRRWLLSDEIFVKIVAMVSKIKSCLLTLISLVLLVSGVTNAEYTKDQEKFLEKMNEAYSERPLLTASISQSIDLGDVPNFTGKIYKGHGKIRLHYTHPENEKYIYTRVISIKQRDPDPASTSKMSESKWLNTNLNNGIVSPESLFDWFDLSFSEFSRKSIVMEGSPPIKSPIYGKVTYIKIEFNRKTHLIDNVQLNFIKDASQTYSYTYDKIKRKQVVTKVENVRVFNGNSRLMLSEFSNFEFFDNFDESLFEKI